jgi:catabolite regulation protein CreA
MRQTMLWILMLTSLSVNAQTGAPFTLVCHVGKDSTGYQDFNIHVDPKMKTVAGHPATITEGEIKWVVTNDEDTTATTINRYTGSANTSAQNKKTGNIVNVPGTCVKATERKF